MKILIPEYILSPDELLTGLAVAFDGRIEAIAPPETLRARYPDAEVETLGAHSLLMPGLINAHVHLEFSANKTDLTYGGFVPWLNSVIARRESLVGGCDDACMRRAAHAMLDAGITAFGAVSSYALDLDAAAAAPQKVVFFNELIGSQAAMADALYGDFLQRLEASEQVDRKGFHAAVAIHSPYSVHPILIKRALALAEQRGMRVSAHYMESAAEREWLDGDAGDFQPFFNDFLKQKSAVNRSKDFLELFRGHRALMTHVVHANDDELAELGRSGHTVVHCPISNRLLGSGAIDLDALERHGVRWICASDGLSSNYRLDLFEEMKIALFMHSDTPLLPLAKRLLRSATVDAADALGLNCGAIEVGKDADLLVLRLDETAGEQLPLHLLLHDYEIERVYIDGIQHKG